MPKLGLTMQEGTVSAWNVAPGDEVKAGDVIFVVETDKIATEVEARGDGRIEDIRVGEGDTVPVGAVVATWTGPALGAEGTDAGQYGAKTAPERLSSPQELPAPAVLEKSTAGERILATPYARRLAKEAGLDLAAIDGSGPGGRIKAADVTPHLAHVSEASLEPARQAAPATIPFSAMIDVDLTTLLDLQARLAAEVDAGFTVGALVERALERASIGTDLAVELVDISATGAAWLLPPLAAGQAILVSMGSPRPEYRPDSADAPVLRQVASLGMVGDPRQISAESGAMLLGAIARLLENPLKILV